MAGTDPVVLITGGGSGMGQLAARQHAERGRTVAVLDVNREGMAQTCADNPRIHSYHVDITDAAAVTEVVHEIETALGPVHSVYNAAAIMPLGKLLDQNTDVIHRLMAINYGGLVNITKAALPAMVARGQGDFVSFASLAGIMPSLYVGAYNATKFAVRAFTEVLYHENRDSGVRFACVCPPVVSTPLLDQGRDTVWPKLFDKVTSLAPEEVLAEIDRCLAQGEFWVYPGKGTRSAVRMRRWFPNLLWKRIHKTEGF